MFMAEPSHSTETEISSYEFLEVIYHNFHLPEIKNRRTPTEASEDKAIVFRIKYMRHNTLT